MRADLLFAILAFASPLAAQTSPKPAPAATPVRFVRAAISQSEDGTPVDSAFVFQPGDVAFFSFQVENYKVGPNSKVLLTGHMQVFDPKGTPVDPPDEQVIGTSLSDEDKEWKPKLRLQVQLPAIAPPGTWHVKYDVTDQQTHLSASAELPFEVGGKGVETAPALILRNLGFYRSQDQEAPLNVIAYRAGDLLWVRFDVVGYKHGEQNAIDVSYDVTVLSPDGSQLFRQEDAATEKSQAFYPQPWVPGQFNLTLQPTMHPGAYTLVITARDGIGNQTVEARAQFQVE
jgi:hypothetical protein